MALKWRKKKATATPAPAPDQPSGPPRKFGVVTREWDPAMGWVTSISADPPPTGIDLAAGAPGWERLRRCLGHSRR
jgi:hypothetical protein